MLRKNVNRFGLVVNVLLLFVIFTMPVFAQPPMTLNVNTVLGPIPAEKMGTTLVHEHFVFAYPGSTADATIMPYDFSEALKIGVNAIKAVQPYGITTIWDATMNDVSSRDPKLYVALSKVTGMNIVCSTGLYTEHEGSPVYWKTKAVWGMDIAKMMSELFIKEITEGIEHTGVKAGLIKVGSSPKMTKYEESVHKAAAIAQKATGVPIITHTEGPTGGPEQAEFLLKEGADPTKVMIGHVSNSKDINYHKAILAKGVYIAFDRIGLDIITPFDVNVKNVAQLCKEGYANQIMLSHDTVNYWPGRQVILPKEYEHAFDNYRIDHISKDFLPALKKAGVTDEQIKTMMVDNPRKLFLGE